MFTGKLRDCLVLKNPYEYAPILCFSFRSLTSDLPALTHGAWGQEIRQWNVGILCEKIANVFCAGLTELLIQGYAATG